MIEKRKSINNRTKYLYLSFSSLKQSFDEYHRYYTMETIQPFEYHNSNTTHLHELNFMNGFKNFLEEIKNHQPSILSKYKKNDYDYYDDVQEKNIYCIRNAIVIYVLIKMLETVQEKEKGMLSISIGQSFSYTYYAFQSIISEMFEFENAHRIYLNKMKTSLMSYKKGNKYLQYNARHSFLLSSITKDFDEETNRNEIIKKIEITKNCFIGENLYFTISLDMNEIYLKNIGYKQNNHKTLNNNNDNTIIMNVCRIPSFCLIS